MGMSEDEEGAGRSGKTSKESPKQRLLAWIQGKLPQHPISNFTSSWNDGISLGALVYLMGGSLGKGRRAPGAKKKIGRGKTKKFFLIKANFFFQNKKSVKRRIFMFFFCCPKIEILAPPMEEDG